MIRLLIGKNRKSQTNMEKARHQQKIMSVNQLSCYHVAIEMYNIINNKSSDSLHEEMKLEPRGYNLRGLEEGKVQVPEKGKKIMHWIPLHWAKAVEFSTCPYQKNNHQEYL